MKLISIRAWIIQLSAKLLVVSLVVIGAINRATAQNLQNWENNEQSRIQQGAAAGAINAQQDSQLLNREAQIEAQQVQYQNQNGGKLTPAQQQQIESEMRGVNRGLNSDIRQNGQNPANYGSPYPHYPSFYGPPNYNGYNPGQNVYGNQYGSQYQNQYPNQSQNLNGNVRHHHHHHDWSNTNSNP